jgi:hypothetical protein
MEKGYAIIERQWQKGDLVKIRFPMEVRQVISRSELKADEGRVALQRGPLVYCVEGADNGNSAWNFILPVNQPIATEKMNVEGESIIALTAEVPELAVDPSGKSVQTVNKQMIAIPYYTWCNRGRNEMQVWLPVSFKNVRVNE